MATKILIVEDNDLNRDMLSRRLLKKDYEVAIAINGEQGLAMVKSEAPDLILLDLGLPGISGWDVAMQVKADAATRHIPIIALTAHSMESDRDKALAAGCNDYDTKPVDFKRLLGKIENALGRPAAESAAPKTPTPAAGGAGIAETQTLIGVQPSQSPRQTPVPAGAVEDVFFTRAVPLQDLSSDTLLTSAPRVTFEGHCVPCIGGNLLLARIGQGGMGAVYYGIHPRLRQQVAIKLLPSQMAEQNPQMVQRFFREGRAAQAIRTPHLVGVLHVGQDDVSGLFFMVMEFIHGLSAGAYLRREAEGGRVGLSEFVALRICASASEGLAAAHAGGIIHRDVKPDNILIPRKKANEPENLDFTAAKIADLGLTRSESDDALTMTQQVMGTPGFMAPEQAVSARDAGKPADVFGLGATLYALLSGRAPFHNSSTMKTLMDTIEAKHAPIQQIRTSISGPTSEIIDRCLKKDPAQRYADAGELAQALRGCLDALADSSSTPTILPQ